MLKGVKKGIKKKIKGKKGKKEDDLFDPEQLEKYKRELEESKKARQQDEESGGAAAGSSSAGHEDDEEWLRFKQLTSGVDAVVNKVSTDLDRIKESSFFQRNKPSEQNRLFASERPAGAIIPTPEKEVPPDGQWVNTEGEENEFDVEGRKVPVEGGAAGFDGEDTTDDPFAFKVVDSPEPVELDDSLFDTTFVDAVATGEIKLSYIPDSPTQDDEDDPFAISSDVANVVKRIEEEEKKEKKRVNLGVAVDVLTGKGDTTARDRPRVKAAENKPKARPRPHAVNLLGDFDESNPPAVPPTLSTNAASDQPKHLFDEMDSPTREKVDLLQAGRAEELMEKAKSTSTKDGNNGINDVVSEFDVIGGNSAPDQPLTGSIPTSIPSSIAALLITSTAPPPPDPEEDELDDEFAALAAESVHKGPSPAPQQEEKAAEEEEVAEEEDEDPFDTSFVEKTGHGKCELKIIENEILGEVHSEKDDKSNTGEEDDDFDFNPRMGESPPKTLVIQNAPKLNPLEDLSPMCVKAPAIQPHVTASGPTLVDTEGRRLSSENVPEEYIDPFDTSKLETVLPGKAELKLLEAELLTSVEQGTMLSATLPDHIVSAMAKKQTEEDEFDFDPRKDEIKHHPLDLPDLGLEAGDTALKVLTPQQDIEIDPFDTSAVSASGLIPGPLELKLLESELVSPTVEAPPPVPSAAMPHHQQPSKMRRTFSDDDFDPRDGIPAPAPKPPPTTEDIFDSAMDFAVDKPLTPVLEAPMTAAPEPSLCPAYTEDPFDTSGIQIENYLAKSELKQVEEELLNAPPEPVRQVRQLPVIVSVEYKKTQQPPQPVIPEPEPEIAVPHPLEAMTPVDDFKPLTPLEAPTTISGVISVFNPSPTVMSDPFDTSIAEGVIPGKTEIKLLEDELGVTAGLNRSLSDDDFNPRQANHPSHTLTSKPLTPLTVQSQMPPMSSCEGDPFTVNVPTGVPGSWTWLQGFHSSNPFCGHMDNILQPSSPYTYNPSHPRQNVSSFNPFQNDPYPCNDEQ